MGNDDDNTEWEEYLDPSWSEQLTFGADYETSPSYSDVETWLIETGIIARSDKDEGRQIDAKRQLYLLKCKLDRVYDTLPKYPKQELDWDKQEVVRILKTDSK